MLKKLYKYELYSLFRNLLPVYAAVLGFALLSRLSLLIKTDNVLLQIPSRISTTIYFFSIVAVFVVGMVVVVMRFYKNLLSGEGYLTFTLPFSATQHIVCKLLCGVLVIIIDFISVIASLLIMGAGTDTLREIIEALRTGLEEAGHMLTAGQLISISAELIIAAVIGMFQSLLMFYAAIAIGQQFKNRIGGAVVAYISLYAAVQVINTFIMIIAVFFLQDIMEAATFTVGFFQIFIALLTVYSLILAAAYFFITRHFLSKRLNLE